MRATKAAVATLALILLATSPAIGEIVNRIAAVVDDEIITLHEVETEARQMILMYRQQEGWTEEQAEERLPKIKQEILDIKVRDKLFEHEVDKLGIPVTDKDVDDYIAYLLERSNLNQAQLREMLRREGKTMSEYREIVKKKIQREQYVQYRVQSGALDVTDEEVRNFYNLHSSEFLLEPEVHLQEIRFHARAGETAQETYARADAVFRKLLEGASFDTMARKHSDSGSAGDGGDIGWFKLKSELKQEYTWVAESLDVGKFSQPQRDGENFFILRLVEMRRSEPKPFADVEEQIKNVLYNQKVDRQIEALTDELFQKSFVDVRMQFYPPPEQ